MVVASTPFVDEFDLAGIESDCDLTLTIADGPDSFYYQVYWSVAIPASPLEPGEERTCRFQMKLSSFAPPILPFGMGLTPSQVDPDPNNNFASVNLIREPPPATIVPAPSLSNAFQALLAVLLVALGISRRTIG